MLVKSLVLSGLVARAAGISNNAGLVDVFYLITLCDKRSLLIIVRNRSLIQLFLILNYYNYTRDFV